MGAFLDALRWGAVTNAETTVLQAPFRAGIAIEDYQLEPITRALTMPRVNLLVADDVGLGKTIEAGLVIQELLLRQRAPLSKAELDWVPASTTHGEGIFLVLQPDVTAAWERAADRSAHMSRLRAAHIRWRNNRSMGARPRTTGQEIVISCCIPFLICWSVK